MSKEPVRKNIDGTDYIFGRLPVKQSLKQLMKIIKIAGPAIGSAANSSGASKVSVSSIIESDLDIEAIMKNLCASIEEDSVFEIIDIFMENVLFEAQPLSVIFEAHFSERGLGHLGKVVMEATKVEYGSFFAGKLGGLMENGLPGTTQES